MRPTTGGGALAELKAFQVQVQVQVFNVARNFDSFPKSNIFSTNNIYSFLIVFVSLSFLFVDLLLLKTLNVIFIKG